jgi:hypothetical protein
MVRFERRTSLRKEAGQQASKALLTYEQPTSLGSRLGPACSAATGTTPDFRVHGLAKRRLCNTVEGRIGRAKACAAYRWAVTAARSRTATISNLARARRALVLRALFGGPKSCALVNLFMICPRWLATSQPTTKSLSDHGYLMAWLSKPPRSLRLARRGVPSGGGNRPARSEGQVGRVSFGGLPFSKRDDLAPVHGGTRRRSTKGPQESDRRNSALPSCF